MIEFFQDIITYQFLQRALIAGFIVGITCSVLSSFVILKKMAFIGHGISHGAFGGVALGLLLGINISLSALVFSLVVSILIWLFSRKKRISEDSAIGILLVTSMALGILFLGFRKQYTYDVFGYLFGNILAVDTNDIYIISFTGIVIIGIIVLFFKEFLYYLFDPESAAVGGLKVDVYHFLLLTLLSMTIVISIKVVGIILVSAYLVISGSTAYLISNRIKVMIWISIVVGMLSSLVGLYLSNAYGLPSGAVIVLVMTLFFLIALGYNTWKKYAFKLDE